ncbi:unnamed protein product, partial [Mesorhabditis belari]|uniref:Uncharacterized protein n=1 Tax=Mesorhabditis belari TaxID=2138241 RepID=A0AAF3EXF0_9BILA
MNAKIICLVALLAILAVCTEAQYYYGGYPSYYGGYGSYYGGYGSYYGGYPGYGYGYGYYGKREAGFAPQQNTQQ